MLEIVDQAPEVLAGLGGEAAGAAIVVAVGRERV
jgi:hypothetical protein